MRSDRAVGVHQFIVIERKQHTFRWLVYSEEYCAGGDNTSEIPADPFVQVSPIHRCSPARSLQTSLYRVYGIQRRFDCSTRNDTCGNVACKL
jgi:hypothetical protein